MVVKVSKLVRNCLWRFPCHQITSIYKKNMFGFATFKLQVTFFIIENLAHKFPAQILVGYLTCRKVDKGYYSYLKTIDFKIENAAHEYMNNPPPPLLHRSFAIDACNRLSKVPRNC